MLRIISGIAFAFVIALLAGIVPSVSASAATTQTTQAMEDCVENCAPTPPEGVGSYESGNASDGGGPNATNGPGPQKGMWVVHFVQTPPSNLGTVLGIYVVIAWLAAMASIAIYINKRRYEATYSKDHSTTDE